MDPNVAWKAMLSALEAANWIEASQYADGLLDWLVRDGFPPTITGRKSVDKLIARAVGEKVAAWDLVE